MRILTEGGSYDHSTDPRTGGRGRGLVLPCSLSKTRVGGFVLALFSLKNPGRGFVLTVFALKNPGERCVNRARSQKPGSGVLC